MRSGIPSLLFSLGGSNCSNSGPFEVAIVLSSLVSREGSGIGCIASFGVNFKRVQCGVSRGTTATGLRFGRKGRILVVTGGKGGSMVHTGGDGRMR